MFTVLLMIAGGLFIFAFGVFMGRSYEMGKQIRGQQPYIPELRERLLSDAEKEGYQRAKMNVPYMMTLDETALALHRIEGLAKGLLDNTSDMKTMIGRYGTESTRPDERTETN